YHGSGVPTAKKVPFWHEVPGNVHNGRIRSLLPRRQR
ncbi:MAG: hypothetical protein JWR39_1161, partial [Devosia sp.]|nr:hypothetical protein [Devosia sp.]